MSDSSELNDSASSSYWSSLSTASDPLRSFISSAFVSGIRQISLEKDREEILAWLAQVRSILEQDTTQWQKSRDIYQSMSVRRSAEALCNSVVQSVQSYRSSKLPLGLKVAMPVTALGAAWLGAHGAGIAAFGGAIGLPVVLLLFLGVTGITTILEAFAYVPESRDPLARLLMTIISMETSRRMSKELAAAMRADAMTPRRAELPPDLQLVMQKLLEMDPLEFERHVMSFFEVNGYPVGLTSRSNDFGLDGIVLQPDGNIVVQCKRYALDHPVGRPVVQQMKGVIEEQSALRGYIVTTSRFTEEALESARLTSRLKLIDGTTLLTWHQCPPATL